MSNQKVLVAGSGKSGIAAARLMLQMGGDVVLYDGNDKLDAEELKEKFEEKDRERLTIVLGELTRTDLLGVELSVISPGIPLDAPFVPVLDDADNFIGIVRRSDILKYCYKQSKAGRQKQEEV